MRQRPLARRGVQLALAGPLLVFAFAMVAACGGSADDSDGVASAGGNAAASASASSSPGAADLDQGRKFAQCMRDHGVPDFPDPDPNGGFGLGSGSKLDQTAVQKALESCRDLLPGGGRNQLDPDQQAKLLQFAQCMRDQGYDVPDPDPNNPGALLGANSKLNRNDPKVRQAIETCQQKVGFNPGGTTQK